MSVEDGRSVCISILRLAAIQVNIFPVLFCRSNLREGKEVEDILSLRDQVVEGKVWPHHGVECLRKLVVFGVYCDDVLLI